MLNSSISSRPKFSCGFCRVLNRPSSHTSIAGSFAIATTRSRKLPMHIWRIVSTCPCCFAGSSSALRRHQARGVACAVRAGHLRIGRGEVVVPEERHLLLERPRAVDHPEEPALAGVADDGVRRERAARRHARVARRPDERVDVIVELLVVDERLDGGRSPELAIEAELLRARAETRPSQEMSDRLVDRGHLWRLRLHV